MIYSAMQSVYGCVISASAKKKILLCVLACRKISFSVCVPETTSGCGCAYTSDLVLDRGYCQCRMENWFDILLFSIRFVPSVTIFQATAWPKKHCSKSRMYLDEDKSFATFLSFSGHAFPISDISEWILALGFAVFAPIAEG